MEHKHLDAAAVERLLTVDRTAEQNEQLFHLLAVCSACREAGGWLLKLHQDKALPLVFGLIDAALARTRAEAPRLLEEITLLDPEDRLACLSVAPRFVSWGLCELLVRESRQTASEQASEAIHLADLAVHVANFLPRGSARRFAALTPSQEPSVTPLRIIVGRRADRAPSVRPIAPPPRRSASTARPIRLFPGREKAILIHAEPDLSRHFLPPLRRTLPLRGLPSPAVVAGAVRSQEVTCFD